LVGGDTGGAYFFSSTFFSSTLASSFFFSSSFYFGSTSTVLLGGSDFLIAGSSFFEIFSEVVKFGNPSPRGADFLSWIFPIFPGVRRLEDPDLDVGTCLAGAEIVYFTSTF
jgi:hypothetical protein